MAALLCSNEAWFLPTYRHNTFELYFQDACDLLKYWERSVGAIMRPPPSPEECDVKSVSQSAEKGKY